MFAFIRLHSFCLYHVVLDGINISSAAAARRLSQIGGRSVVFIRQQSLDVCIFVIRVWAWHIDKMSIWKQNQSKARRERERGRENSPTTYICTAPLTQSLPEQRSSLMHSTLDLVLKRWQWKCSEKSNAWWEELYFYLTRLLSSHHAPSVSFKPRLRPRPLLI